MPASAALSSRCRSCSFDDLVENREQLLLELVLQLLRELVDLGLGVLLEALTFDVHPLDVLLERCARGLADERAARLQLLLRVGERLALGLRLVLLLLHQRLHLGGQDLPSADWFAISCRFT